MIYKGHYDSPIGKMTIASDGKAITGLLFENQKYYESTIDETPTLKEDLPVFLEVRNWLDRYFAGEKPAIKELPLNPKGSLFRQMVWDILKEIPYGKVITYGDIAKSIAKKMGREKMSAQAIGGAVGHNPISIIVPCHRVIGSDGSLTGYAGGLEIKEKLLVLEGVKL